ncbi:MAG TPA: ATP-binding protein [bacterium]|nr:ATP-binding protein [bacterium]HPY15007.1 ATP-binding protein [bacterium]HQB09265.1 ATP-binding protein [bacterium]HQM84193.1 ATP-binding protein [bacterium]
MIKRDMYLKKLIGFKDHPLIKVITGIRRCGKSTLLELFREYLLENGVKNDQIISINFEDMNFSNLDDAQKLHDFVDSRLKKNAKNYVFLDEIQKVVDFQKAVDGLYIKKNVDIYITGSNAHLLSGELATLLSGRYVEIEMLPLSFKEYIEFTGKNDLSRKFADYVRYSSFPFAVYLNNDAGKVRDYLSGIYNTVILKDVVAKKKIADMLMLESVVRFMFDNIGSLMSTKKIADTMTSDGRKISTHTVESYISALMDSFIIYRAKRYDVKGKQYLKTNDKYYICDIGLRSFLLGNKGGDAGYVLENVIYLELLRRGYDVYVGKVGDKEVDFVAIKQDTVEYYQVALTVRDENKLKTELASLQAISDHNPKYLLTLDDDPPANHNGIKQINAIDFLME